MTKLAGIRVLFRSKARDCGLKTLGLGFVLMASGCAGLAVSPKTYPVDNFVVFDALSFHGKPDLSLFGFKPIKGIERFWPLGMSQDEVNEPGVISEMDKLGKYQGLVFIDIEHWPVFGVPPAIAQQSIAKLTRVIEIAKHASPQCQFGYYGLLPASTYWDLVSNDPKKLTLWHEVNHRTEALAEHVDVVLPSLYTFYNDEKGWEQAARLTLLEARRYGKPIYPFLWPDFHDSNKELGGKAIPASFWRKELELCRELADGVVLWGGWQRNTQQDRWVQKEWKADAEWWRETMHFLRSVDRPR